MISVWIPTNHQFPLDASILKHNIIILQTSVSSINVLVTEDTDLYPLITEFPTINFETSCSSHLHSMFHESIANKSHEIFAMYLHPLIKLDAFNPTSALSLLGKDDVFGLAGNCLFTSPEIQNVSLNGFYRAGWFYTTQPTTPLPDKSRVFSFNDFCFIIDVEKYLDLHGFDPMFQGIQGSSKELCYRASLKKWPIHYDKTWTSQLAKEIKLAYAFNNDLLKQNRLGNTYLLIWKNLGLTMSTLSHITWILFMFLFFRIKHTRAILKTCFYIPRLLKNRPIDPST
ncbi:hypothetical protein HOH45_08545 [bacterium]|jgi:hypothetical protein|nr:hypothetical protein [bacterium]